MLPYIIGTQLFNDSPDVGLGYLMDQNLDTLGDEDRIKEPDSSDLNDFEYKDEPLRPPPPPPFPPNLYPADDSLEAMPDGGLRVAQAGAVLPESEDFVDDGFQRNEHLLAFPVETATSRAATQPVVVDSAESSPTYLIGEEDSDIFAEKDDPYNLFSSKKLNMVRLCLVFVVLIYFLFRKRLKGR